MRPFPMIVYTPGLHILATFSAPALRDMAAGRAFFDAQVQTFSLEKTG